MAKEAIVTVLQNGHQRQLCLTVHDADTPQTVRRFIETHYEKMTVVALDLK